MGGHAGDGGGGVPLPQVDSHLEVAEHHAHHGEEVGHQEQHDVVPAVVVEVDYIVYIYTILSLFF